MLGVVDESMFTSHPTEIGPYKVLEVLGQGGVGTVYLVQQREPFRRKAALKLIKLGMDTREVLVRFAQERQLLASMSHPNIAKVFDAGQTETGRPFFVMEYVAGEPITDYCDRHRLSLSERLELFVTVCRALQHAHQKGILHRDVKPSNLLVMNQDGKHVPMVIDFGLAKVLRTEPASAHLLTREGQFLGTPRYMSPEQIELPSDEVDTRSDVYSLGVVLFELLTGEPPYERRITDGGLPKLLHSIRAEESTRPSTRLTQLRKEVAEVADKRRTDRAALLAQVRGDLDWLVVKALERDRDRRYQSAAELAADVERYLRRDPILARPPTASYRIERYVRRNPLAVGGLLAVVLALMLGSGGSLYWFYRANQLRETKAALMGMCESIRTDVADAHIWFEEVIAHDPSQELERDVLVPIKRSAERVASALEGATPSPEQVAAREPAMAEQLRILEAHIEHMRVVTMERWNAKDDAGRIGGALDQQYDAIYKDIRTLCSQLVTSLNESSARDWKRAAESSIAVNAAFVLALLSGSVLVLRFWAKRS
ncbi:MAG: serine/threonine protein kinase [Planctomycetes bacterium]|nr:serine/threonine protein kinase [Planctomycetota bacterium]